VRGRGVGGPYLLAGPSGGEHHDGRLGDGKSSMELLVVYRKKTRRFCKKPPRLWGFMEILKTALVLKDFVISTCLEHCEIIQGLPY
jgi:hypothetical protein